MQTFVALLLLGAIFWCVPGRGYVMLDQGGASALMLAHQGRIHYQPCAATALGNLSSSPEEALKQCAGAEKRPPFSVSEGEYIVSLAALYGVPSASLAPERGTSLLSDLALKAEQLFRAPKGGQSPSELSFYRLSLAYEDLIQFFGPDSHLRLSEKDSSHHERRVAVVQALHPFFSDGRLVLHLGKGTLQSDNADCRPQTALADWRAVVEIFSSPNSGGSLASWLGRQMPNANSPFKLGTWLPHYRANRARDGKMGYTFGTVSLELSLLPETLAWIRANHQTVAAADRRAPLESVPGYGSVVRDADGKLNFPVICFSRVARLPLEVKPVSPGSLTLEGLAARYGMTRARFERWALNDPTIELLLAPAVVLGIPVGEDYFASALRAPLDRLMGRDLPRLENVEAAAVELEKKAAAEKARVAKEETERLTRIALAAAAEKERADREAQARVAEAKSEEQRWIRAMQQEAVWAQEEFDRAKAEDSEAEYHFCANSARPLKLWLAVKWNGSWGWTTYGFWNIPAFRCILAYRGRDLGNLHYYATNRYDVAQPGHRQLLLQMESDPANAVQADRSRVVPGEIRVGFAPFRGNQNVMVLNDKSGIPEAQAAVLNGQVVRLQ